MLDTYVLGTWVEILGISVLGAHLFINCFIPQTRKARHQEHKGNKILFPSSICLLGI